MVKVTIDDREIEVPAGTLLVEAAARADIEVPVFCHHRKLDPAGVCRMCLVEVEGQRKPVTACTMPVTDGMVARTDTEQIRTLRKGVLEFLLLNHPLDCPVCDKGGECPLQDNTFKYGPAASRSLDAKVRDDKAVELGNFIVLDRERCILCRRCTRFDDEITQEQGLVIAERAMDAIVATADGQRYDSYFSGNTIELCPVGALTSEIYRFKARPWDLGHADAVCTGCSVGCNIRLDFRFGELVRVVSRENEEVDGGWLCDRGRFNYRYVQESQRIQKPMVKEGGRLVETTWEKALSHIGARLKRLRREGAGAKAGVIGGGRLTNEEAYLLQKFARAALRTPNVDHRVAGQTVASVGAFEGRMTDVDRADAILLVDLALAERAPVLDLRVRRAGERGGARIVSVGPEAPRYRSGVAAFAEPPGETARLLRGRKIRQALGEPQRLVAIWDGSDPEAGRELLKLLASYEKKGAQVSLLIPGEQGNSRGAEAMGVRPDLLPGGFGVEDEQTRRRLEESWGETLPEGPGLDTEGMLKAAASGDLEVLLLFGANLAGSYPDGDLARRALEAVPFLVAVDLFLTETAELADVVLPASAFAAKAGSYLTLDGRLQTVEAAMEPEFASKPDGEIIRALAAAAGAPIVPSAQELRWELQHHLGPFEDGRRLPGLRLELAEAALERGEGRRAAEGDGLILTPVERLYAGGGTAHFDSAFAHAQPKPFAALHPSDAAALGVSGGDVLLVESDGVRLRLTAELNERVAAGTLQAPKGLPGVPVTAMCRGGALPRVSVTRQVLEEVG